MKLQRLPKIFLALLIQGLALAILALGVWLMQYVVAPPYPLWGLAIVQGLLAAFLSCRLGLPCWWRWIQFLLPVGLFYSLEAQVEAWWALVVFVGLFLIFFNALGERVPLYLSNETTREALKKLVSSMRSVKFIDLGSGLGGTVAFMAQQPNVEVSEGVETAPIPYLISKMVTAFKGGRILWRSLWRVDLSQYQVVYAFLSPDPMPKLWHKVITEMRPGTIFVTNSFAVPDVEPTEVWELEDSRKTKLFIYQLTEEGGVAQSLNLDFNVTSPA